MCSLGHFGKEVNNHSLGITLLPMLDFKVLIPERRLEASQVEMCHQSQIGYLPNLLLYPLILLDYEKGTSEIQE